MCSQRGLRGDPAGVQRWTRARDCRRSPSLQSQTSHTTSLVTELTFPSVLLRGGGGFQTGRAAGCERAATLLVTLLLAGPGRQRGGCLSPVYEKMKPPSPQCWEHLEVLERSVASGTGRGAWVCAQRRTLLGPPALGGFVHRVSEQLSEVAEQEQRGEVLIPALAVGAEASSSAQANEASSGPDLLAGWILHPSGACVHVGGCASSRRSSS